MPPLQCGFGSIQKISDDNAVYSNNLLSIHSAPYSLHLPTDQEQARQGPNCPLQTKLQVCLIQVTQRETQPGRSAALLGLCDVGSLHSFVTRPLQLCFSLSPLLPASVSPRGRTGKPVELQFMGVAKSRT